MLRMFSFIFVICLIKSIFVNNVYSQLDVRIGVGDMTMIINEINATASSNALVHPREYTVYGSMGCVYGGGVLIASRNFRTNWYFDGNNWIYVAQDTIIPYFVSEATSRYYQDPLHSTVILPEGMLRYWKYEAPIRIVDDINYSEADWQDYDVVADGDTPCDQIVVASCNTASGINFTQKAYAFGSQDYDDFILLEYIFKNTGNIDADPDIEYPNNQVLECYLGIKFVPQPSGLTSKIIDRAGGWNAQVDDWIDYYSGIYNGERIHVLYGWDGDCSPSYYTQDDEGDPLPASGIFMSPQYPGMAILHVDRSVNDRNNNPGEPHISYYSYGGANANNTLSLGSTGVGEEAIYTILSTNAHIPSPLNWDLWNSSQIEEWRIDNNPNREHYKTGTLGFGPYDFFNIGDSVRIFACFTAGSMGWENAVIIGDRWRRNDISQSEKNQWLRSGRDSLFTKISHISQLFRDIDGNFNLQKGANLIPKQPESPGLILSSAVNGVDIEIKDVQADYYRIYRRLKPEFYLEDTPTELLKNPYPLIAELSPNELSFSDNGMLKWTDETVIAGNNYWYAVTSINAEGIESSRFLNRTNPTESDPTRGSVVPVKDAATHLDSVYVVPNPYHIKSERLYNMATGIIKFHGLPAACRIRIYTQSADHIATIKHELTVPPSNLEEWNLLTDSQQFLASGLYIFVVDQAKDGLGRPMDQTKIGKFVIIR